ncbi:MAG: discoidin domain-containing protein, partial [Nitrospinota bacterium]|nr:discoidin domain-containing protein [Nitrospinota bacterium]
PGVNRPFLYRVTQEPDKSVRLAAVTEAPPGHPSYAWGEALAATLAKEHQAEAIYYDTPGVLNPSYTTVTPQAVSLVRPLFHNACRQAASGVNTAYILSEPGMIESVRSAARAFNASFKEFREKKFTILHSFIPPNSAPELKTIPPLQIEVEASSNPSAIAAAIDSNAATFWSSNSPQENITIQFALPSRRMVAGVDLLSTYPENSPLHLEIDISIDGNVWTQVASMSSQAAAMRFYGSRFSFIPRTRLLSYRFSPSPAKYIRLRQTAQYIVDWHIAETWILESATSQNENDPISVASSDAPPVEWREQWALGDPFALARLWSGVSWPNPEPLLLSGICLPPNRVNGRDPAIPRPVEGLKSIIGTSSSAPAVEAYLNSEGAKYTIETSGIYRAWRSIVHPLTTRIPIPGSYIVSVSASHNQEVALAAYDEDISTSWRSGVAQAAGMSLTIQLANAMVVSGVALDAGEDLLDLPRGAQVEISEDGIAYLPVENPRNAHRRFIMEEGRPVGEDSAMLILFDQVKAAYIRVTLIEDREAYNWSAREVSVYKPAPLKDIDSALQEAR